MKRALLSLVVVAALAGCASFYKPSEMTAEQLKAMASDNKGVGYCMSAQNATGNVTGTFANLDLVNKVAGTVTIEPGCRMVITGGAAASAPRP